MKILFIAYDNDSHIAYFPLGYAYLAAVCEKAGHEVIIYQQDTHHWPDEHLTKYLDENDFDVVGLGASAGYYQYKRVIALSKAINQSINRPFFVLGGHIVTPEPEYFLQKTSADAIIMGEGELIICKLLSVISRNGDLAEVDGIAYMKESEIVINNLHLGKRE